MRYRTFGRTGLQVSELVFGGGFVGGLLLHQDDDTKHTAIQRALKSGINWIDTAPSYGNGASEQALGWLLAEVEQQPYLSTKFSIATDRLDDISGQIETSLEGSLQRLNRDSVDLLQLHNRIEPHGANGSLTAAHILGSGGVADQLDRLREQGLFRYIGITALGNAKSCHDVIASGRFDSAQVYYNMLNPSAGQSMPSAWLGHNFANLIETCQVHGVAVMAIRVLAAGILATDIRHGREIIITPHTDVAAEEQRAKAAFASLGSSYGSRAQTALRFVLAHHEIACAIVGLAKLSHLDEALKAAELDPLPKSALDPLQTLYQTDFGLMGSKI